MSEGIAQLEEIAQLEGITAELEGVEFGDKRLNKRSKHIIERLANNPEASVNAACDGESETMAAYRFFDNNSVEPSRILKPHFDATMRRIADHPVVLILQDTTELDFTKHPARDARCLNKENRFGLYEHIHLAVTPEQLCMGVVGAESFDRSPESLGKAAERAKLPIEEKESFRWLTGYRLASRISDQLSDTRIVSIADREADIHEIFEEAQERPTGADFVIRAKEDRCTPDLDPDSGPNAYHKVKDVVRESECRIRQTIDLPRTPKRKARVADLEIRVREVSIKPPRAHASSPSVTYNVVLVEEINGPGDGTDISWQLVTTLPIDTVEEIQRVIEYYRARWTIEKYFRILKTGCRVEEIQLETKSRLENCLALYMIIAWRLLYVTHSSRECPDLPCTVVFDDSEWKPVWRITTDRDLPEIAPTLSEFMPLLARLGGYNNRGAEPAPGPQVIWRGIRRMADFAIAWITFGPDGKERQE